MGSSLLGGSQKSTSKTDPWGPQQDYLKDTFQNAQDLYNSKSGSGWYDGDLYASMDGLTRSGIEGVGNYAFGAGQDMAGQVGSTSTDLLRLGGGYSRSLGAFQGMASADPTQANLQSAAAYSDNPYLSGAIDAASRDVTRNLRENDLPAIDRAATASGNINSTRAGIASGVAMRGAQDRIGDIASTMRGDAFAQGLDLAERSRQANLNGMGQAAGLYGDAVRSGLSGAGQSQAMTYNNLGQVIDAGNLNQADAQGQLDADFMRWQGNDTRDQDLLNQYYSIIGANNWGGTTTTKTSGGPGILGGVLGLASTGLGIAGGLGGMGLLGKGVLGAMQSTKG